MINELLSAAGLLALRIIMKEPTLPEADEPCLLYRIEGVEVGGASTSRVRWLDVRAEADAARPDSAPDSQPASAADWPMRRAESWLAGHLAHGEATPSTAALQAADEAGHAWSTVRRAATNIGVIVEKAKKFGEPDLWRPAK